MKKLGRQETGKSQASRYRHYVNFQQNTGVSDGEGGFNKVWVNIAGSTDIPVEIIPIKAERREEMRSRNVIATHYIACRSNITINEVGRVVFGSRIFYIHHLEDIQTRDIEQFMVAEERRI